MPAEAGLLQLPGAEPAWIWAFTCPTPGCDCREATVLWTGGDRETLLARCGPVAEAWRNRTGHAKAAAQLEGVTAFAIDIDIDIDIDEGGAFDIRDPEAYAALDLEAHPEARDVVQRIDGEVLDAIGRLWYLGKGLPDPERKNLATKQIPIDDWMPGEMVGWGEALEGLREDLFRVGEHDFEAADLYCVAAGCDCGSVVVDFAPVALGGAPRPGAVRVAPSGDVTFEPEHENHRERLRELWAAFVARYPRYRERFARRSSVMHSLAGKIVAAPRRGVERTSPKVGRNDPCPCGSGKKHKKCCEAT
jgi:hypothetical protein